MALAHAMSLDTVICGNVSTSLCAKYCCIREHSPAIDTVGISIDSRLIGDCSCLRYLYFDQHPHILKRRIKTESFVYDIAIVVVVVFVFFRSSEVLSCNCVGALATGLP